MLNKILNIGIENSPEYRCRCGLEPKGSRWWILQWLRLPGHAGHARCHQRGASGWVLSAQGHAS